MKQRKMTNELSNAIVAPDVAVHLEEIVRACIK